MFCSQLRTSHSLVCLWTRLLSKRVSREGGSLLSLSDAFLNRDEAKVQNISQTAGANGIGLDGHSAQPFAYETFSAVCWSAVGVATRCILCNGFAPLETHNFSHDMSYHGNYPVQKGHNYRRLSSGLGRHLRGQNNKWHIEVTDAVVSNKLSGTPGCVTGAETFSSLLERAACSGQDGQYHDSGIHQQTGWVHTHYR